MNATPPSALSHPAKVVPAEMTLPLGDLVADIYRACGKRKANGIIRLGLKAPVMEFRGNNRLVNLKEEQRY